MANTHYKQNRRPPFWGVRRTIEIDDRLDPRPLVVAGEAALRSQDDETRVQLDPAGEVEEIRPVHRDDDLVVLVGVAPDLGVGRAGQPDVGDVNGRHALRGEARHHRRGEIPVDENVHPPPRTNFGRFLGRPGGRPRAAYIFANSTSSARSAG